MGEPGARGGVYHLWDFGRRGHPPVPCPARVSHPPRADAARAGGSPRGRWLRPCQWEGGCLHCNLGPGRDEPGHWPGHGPHGLVAGGGHHRPGGHTGDRHRRVSGGGYRRHHPAHHQAQLPGHRRTGVAQCDQGGFPHRPHRQAGSGTHRHRQGCPGRRDRVRIPRQRQPAGLSHSVGGPQRADSAGRRDDR